VRTRFCSWTTYHLIRRNCSARAFTTACLVAATHHYAPAACAAAAAYHTYLSLHFLHPPGCWFWTPGPFQPHPPTYTPAVPLLVWLCYGLLPTTTTACRHSSYTLPLTASQRHTNATPAGPLAYNTTILRSPHAFAPSIFATTHVCGCSSPARYWFFRSYALPERKTLPLTAPFPYGTPQFVLLTTTYRHGTTARRRYTNRRMLHTYGALTPLRCDITHNTSALVYIS